MIKERNGRFTDFDFFQYEGVPTGLSRGTCSGRLNGLTTIGNDGGADNEPRQIRAQREKGAHLKYQVFSFGFVWYFLACDSP